MLGRLEVFRPREGEGYLRWSGMRRSSKIQPSVALIRGGQTYADGLSRSEEVNSGAVHSEVDPGPNLEIPAPIGAKNGRRT